MMREATIIKYTGSIEKMIANDVSIHHDKFTEISRAYFGNFVTMHYMKKAGCLIEVSPKIYKFNSHIPVKIIIDSYDKFQSNAGKKAMKKHREKINNNSNGLIFHTPIGDNATELVAKLRALGYEVVCKKIIEL